jgi:hypothetical protein
LAAYQRHADRLDFRLCRGATLEAELIASRYHESFGSSELIAKDRD